MAKHELSGMKETIAALEDLDKKLRKKIVRTAARKVMTPIAKDAKRRAPKRTGALKKSIGVKQSVNKKQGVVITRIGARKGYDTTIEVKGRDGTTRKEKVNPSRYAHLVEFGDADTQAHAFLRPAWDSAEPKLPASIEAELKKAIQKTTIGKRVK